MPDTAPVIWSPDRAPVTEARPGLIDAMTRGVMGRCPCCGEARLFNGFLRPVTACASCGTELGRLRADDIPPYVTIMIVGHIVVPLMLWMERAESPPTWLLSAVFVPLTLVLTIGLLRPVKGAVMGLMLHLGMLRPEGDA